MDLEVKSKGFDFDNLLDFNQGRINIARVYAEAYADYPIVLLRVNKAYVKI